jgi:hypothetical protein
MTLSQAELVRLIMRPYEAAVVLTVHFSALPIMLQAEQRFLHDLMEMTIEQQGDELMNRHSGVTGG